MKCSECDIEMDYVKYYDNWLLAWSAEFESDKNSEINIMFCPKCGKLRVVKKNKEK